MNLLDVRRRVPRISVNGFCGVAVANDLHHASLSNLSTLGFQVERPFDPATARPVVQLEIELPGLDEVVWASAIVTRALLTPMPGRTATAQPRFWCRAGLVLDNTSRRERALLRDYVVDQLVTHRMAAKAGDRRGDVRD